VWTLPQDLSLLTHLSSIDIEQLQSVGKEAQAERQKFILKDDQERVWQHLKSVKGGRVDFVLDNGERRTCLGIIPMVYETTAHAAGFEVISERNAPPPPGDLTFFMQAVHRPCFRGFLSDIHTICIKSMLSVSCFCDV
jgi:Damage-control phosphatase ARMT1-like domain